MQITSLAGRRDLGRLARARLFQNQLIDDRHAQGINDKARLRGLWTD
jgi:hypothetical protein